MMYIYIDLDSGHVTKILKDDGVLLWQTVQLKLLGEEGFSESKIPWTIIIL